MAELPDYPVPQQIIREIHHGTPGNGYGRISLNTIVLGVAAFGMMTLFGIVAWQMQRMIEKLDNVSTRLTVVETTLRIQPPQPALP